MTQEQYAFLYTQLSDIIQMSCDSLLQSDFLINFPDWNNSWYLINYNILNACEKLGYISETCNNSY